MRLTSKNFANKEILNARHIFRFGALAVPLSMAVYGLLVYFGTIPAAPTLCCASRFQINVITTSDVMRLRPKKP